MPRSPRVISETKKNSWRCESPRIEKRKCGASSGFIYWRRSRESGAGETRRLRRPMRFAQLTEQLLTVHVLLPDVISTPNCTWPTVPLGNLPLFTSHLKIAARLTLLELDWLVRRNDHGPPG